MMKKEACAFAEAPAKAFRLLALAMFWWLPPQNYCIEE
jgi:hypothetical protein